MRTPHRPVAALVSLLLLGGVFLGSPLAYGQGGARLDAPATPPRPVAERQGCRDLGQVELAFPCRSGEVRKALAWAPDGSAHTLTYELIDGQAVFEGDILLDLDEDGNVALGARELQSLSRDRSTGRADSTYRWPGATVPYAIDPYLPDQDRVTSAIAEWEANTELTFVERTWQDDYVYFGPGDGCSSWVGRQGGRQKISLADDCSTGNTIHEIGHAVGLWHEQSRSDRDEAVIVHWENVESGKEHAFQTYVARGEDGFDLGPHDFGSIMHYGSYAFTANGQPTLTRLDGSLIFAQRSALSAGDIDGAEHMYPTPPFTVSITGPTSREPGQSGTWSVESVSGGEQPYSYSWYKTTGDGSTSLGSGTSATTSDTVSFNIICDVVDATGDLATDHIFVDVDGDSETPLPE